jgi:hypothetical protein
MNGSVVEAPVAQAHSLSRLVLNSYYSSPLLRGNHKRYVCPSRRYLTVRTASIVILRIITRCGECLPDKIPNTEPPTPTFAPRRHSKSNSFFDSNRLAIMTEDNETTSPLLGDHQPPEYGATGGAPAPAEPRTSFRRNLGTAEAFSIIISIVIGSGIFTSPGSIDTNVPSPGFALIVWLVGGILAWTGAATMAELGTAIPGEGMGLSLP